MKQKKLYTKKDKLKWFGDGEWVNEADAVYFKYMGYGCRILRHIQVFSDDHIKGGTLTGYVRIPKDCPYFQKSLKEIQGNLGKEISYAQKEKKYILFDNGFWIGFETSYYDDYDISYMQIFDRENYKNIQQVTRMCQLVVNELREKTRKNHDDRETPDFGKYETVFREHRKDKEIC